MDDFTVESSVEKIPEKLRNSEFWKNRVFVVLVQVYVFVQKYPSCLSSSQNCSDIRSSRDYDNVASNKVEAVVRGLQEPGGNHKQTFVK